MPATVCSDVPYQPSHSREPAIQSALKTAEERMIRRQQDDADGQEDQALQNRQKEAQNAQHEKAPPAQKAKTV